MARHQIEIGPGRIAVSARRLEIIQHGPCPIAAPRGPGRSTLHAQIGRRAYSAGHRIRREEFEDVGAIFRAARNDSGPRRWCQGDPV